MQPKVGETWEVRLQEGPKHATLVTQALYLEYKLGNEKIKWIKKIYVDPKIGEDWVIGGKDDRGIHIHILCTILGIPSGGKGAYYLKLSDLMIFIVNQEDITYKERYLK